MTVIIAGTANGATAGPTATEASVGEERANSDKGVYKLRSFILVVT